MTKETRPIRHAFAKSLIASAALATAGASLAADTLKVGLLSTLSGPGAALGVDIRDGFQLAVKLNGGKLGGLPAEVIVADDNASPATGRQTADRLVRRDKVDFMTGAPMLGIFNVATLFGRNGMGKTTTVRSILGMLRPRGGSVRFLGERIDGLAPDRIARCDPATSGCEMAARFEKQLRIRFDSCDASGTVFYPQLSTLEGRQRCRPCCPKAGSARRATRTVWPRAADTSSSPA